MGLRAYTKVFRCLCRLFSSPELPTWASMTLQREGFQIPRICTSPSADWSHNPSQCLLPRHRIPLALLVTVEWCSQGAEMLTPCAQHIWLLEEDCLPGRSHSCQQECTVLRSQRHASCFCACVGKSTSSHKLLSSLFPLSIDMLYYIISCEHSWQTVGYLSTATIYCLKMESNNSQLTSFLLKPFPWWWNSIIYIKFFFIYLLI